MTGPANMVEGGGAAALDFEASAIVAAHAAAIKMDAARKALLAEKLAIATAEWRAEVQAMIEAPDIGSKDRRTLRMILRWKKPGRSGIAIVAEIKARQAQRQRAA